MKPLGPYVAARDLPGRMNSPVRTLRATDRLTGMPVLLHGLPGPLPLPDLPAHPGVLPFAECVLVAGEAFMVTELPLQARPAQDPDLTARGALAALAALHGRGVVHGGLSASQLWSVDGEVRLAGAGLPWGGDARPADDLYALAVILHEMGGVPGALRPLLDAPGTLDARAALRLLHAPTTQLRAAPDTPEHTEAAPGASAATTPVTPEPVPVLTDPTPTAAAPTAFSQAPSVQVATVQVASVQATPAQPAPNTPPAGDASGARGRRGRGSRFRLPGLGATREAAAPDELTTPVPTATAATVAASVEAVPASALAPVVPADGPTLPPAAAILPDARGTGITADVPVAADAPAHDGTPIVLGDGAIPAPAAGTGQAGAPKGSAPAEPPVLPDVPAQPAGTGGPLSPQERRRREHEARQEHAQRDAQAAAERRAQRLEQRQQEQRTQEPPVAPAPIQIGFDDLPEWETDAPAPRSGVQIREVPRLPESLRRAPLPGDPAAGEDQGPAAEVPVGALPARRRVGEPIRIGWDEDDSWRVVREAPAPVRTRRPLVWRALFWVVLVAAFVGMALLLTRVVQARGAGPVTPASVPQVSGAGAASGGADASAAPQAQTVQFTVRGVAGATARLSVEQSPKEANLAPGASLGTAPGRVTFPVPGTYRVRVVVDGFAPGSMTVTVPRSQPVTIDLDR